MKDLERMNDVQLHSLSFRKTIPCNAFAFMNFGSNPYGINGATPADPLHQINLGLVDRLPDVFMTRLSVGLVKVLDSHVAYFGTYFSNQSERDIPNIGTFKNGISTSAKLTAKEKLNRVFAVYITLLSSDFETEVVGKKAVKKIKKPQQQ